jgi:hypothetical protein
MTAIEPEARQRRSRRLDYLIAHPDATDEQAGQVVDAQIAAEEEANAEGKRHIDGIVASLDAMTTCACCRVNSAFGSPDALCARCRSIVQRLQAERLGAEKVNGKTRRQLAERYLDSRPELT